MPFVSEPHNLRAESDRIGVLLINLGTPDAPTKPALRRYLAEFLWDPRVVETPRWLWWCILNGIILNTRPARSAAAYHKVWTDEGSPLLAISRAQQAAVQAALSAQWNTPVTVELGMRYGSPSIPSALEALRQARCRRMILFPLFPQYSGATNSSAFDVAFETMRDWRRLSEVRTIPDYFLDDGYVKALAASVRDVWDGGADGRPDALLMSFHGIPKRYVMLGDPYARQCHRTARALIRELDLKRGQYRVSFQSRLGRDPWLKPYTDLLLPTLPARGVKRLDVICPGFSADCLETLEELAMADRDIFLNAGGEHFRYIPCLNERPDHIEALATIITRTAGDWLPPADT